VQTQLLSDTEVVGEAVCLTFRGVVRSGGHFVAATVHHIMQTVNKMMSRIVVTEIFFVSAFVSEWN